MSTFACQAPGEQPKTEFFGLVLSLTRGPLKGRQTKGETFELETWYLGIWKWHKGHIYPLLNNPELPAYQRVFVRGILIFATSFLS